MMSAPQSLTVYVLKSSKDDKYYIGGTRRPLLERIGEHAAGQGSAWTNKHPMDTCLEYKLDASPLDEDSLTKKYMCQYGIENVRGGAHVAVVLPPETIRVLQQEMANANGACFRCLQKGHYATACPNPAAPASPAVPAVPALKVFPLFPLVPLVPQPVTPPKRPAEEKQRPKRRKYDRDSDDEDESEEEEDDRGCCFRCGRDSHWVADCYATYDACGRRI